MLQYLNKRKWPLVVVSEGANPLTFASEVWTVENGLKSVIFLIFSKINFKTQNFLSSKSFILIS